MKPQFYFKKLVIFIFTLMISLAFGQKKFKLILDAGHGGHDAGTNRKYSDLGHIKEKDIALKITLMVGKMLEKNKDFKVIYTRKTDVYPTLGERTDLANNSKADLFVSIHCNAAARRSAHGTETFVQGPDQNKTNLEVAKRENAVIFLDKKDRKRFANYNPNSPESLIALKIQQSKYLQKSLILGGLLENNFTKKDGRFSRGVRQKNLHVLRLNAMPSVLIETGFISNKEDAKYLISYKGQKEVAKSIYNAIVDYKKTLDRKKGKTNKKKKKKKVERKLSNDYRILIKTTRTRFNLNSPNFRGLKYILPIKEGKFYKYYYGVTNYDSRKKINLETAKNAGFRNAYAVGFVPNQYLSSGYYRIEIAVTQKRLSSKSPILSKLKNIKRHKLNGRHYYTYGKANTLEKAILLQKKLERMGIKNTIIEKVKK